MEINAFTNVRTESAQAGNDVDRLTAALHECWPGGPIVSNPAECKDSERDTWRITGKAMSSLPSIDLVDPEQGGPQTELAGRTRRSNGAGQIINERDAWLDRLYG